ncbi:hypothetical protein ABH924_003320 [Arthrobacter sp. GAS37]|uniref:pilus assembly protein n=1 Tax=Arthrobacter sp. GAS37 TaxID=3156261 RepID=UPI003833F40A
MKNPAKLRRNETGERGSETVGTVVIATFWVLLICGVIAAIRWTDTTSNVEQVAQAAARDASLQRDQISGIATANQSVQVWAAAQKLQCTSLRSIVDSSGFQSPLGSTGFVKVTVSCDVSFSDLFLPGMPGSRTVTKTASSAIDAYRER